MTSTGPETPDKAPPAHETTRDPVAQPPRTEDQVVSTTDAQETGGGAVAARRAAPGEAVAVARRQGMFGSSLGNDTSGYGGLDAPVLFPKETGRPYGSYFDEVVDALEAAAPEAFAAGVEGVAVDRGELTINVRREQLPALVKPLRDDARLRFEFCSGVSGVHWPQQTGAELHAVYHFQSLTHGRRVRFEVTCPDADPRIPSIVAVYPAVDWHERETWDMFGIVFEGHPGLTRILMPDDWPGHPQRKDYPLGGIPVEYKGATIEAPDERRSYS